MIQLHVSGRLVRDPAPKTSASGKPYVHALMTASSGDAESLISLLAFDTELGNLLTSLRKGDSLSAIGNGSVRGYLDKKGEPAAGVTLMANRLMVMSDRQAAPRPRTERRPDRRQYQPADPREFSDDIPF